MILKGTLDPSMSVSSTVIWLEVSSSPLCQREALQSQRAACGCPLFSPASPHGAGGGAHTEKKGSSRPHSKLELLCLASPHLRTPPRATSRPERRRCDLGALHGSMQKDGSTKINIKAPGKRFAWAMK